MFVELMDADHRMVVVDLDAVVGIGGALSAALSFI